MTILFAMVLLACQEEKKNVVPNVKNAREVPTMVTRNVETFISDSGITRYHISAITSTSQRTFFGRVFTATQLRAGFEVKYLP